MPSKYLPIGSIVKVKNIDKEIMIAGYCNLEYNNSLEIFDYVGVAYPEGLLIKSVYSFNHSDIISLIYTGYLSDDAKNLSNNLLGKLNKKDLEFDENGVVIREEGEELKDSLVVDTLVENPFINKDIIKTDISTPVVDIKLDNLDTLENDSLAKKDTLEIEKKFNFTFDEFGVVTGEVAVEIPKTEANLRESKYVYEFDENGVVTGVKTIGGEEEPKYSFDEFGRVIADGDKKEEEFVIPHYKFDENGVVIV